MGGELPPIDLPLIAVRTGTTAYLAITIATIDGPIATGSEWNLGFLATLGTHHREHLTQPPTHAIASLPTAGQATLRTPLGFVGVALLSMKGLVVRAEDEGLPTVLADKSPVLIDHR